MLNPLMNKYFTDMHYATSKVLYIQILLTAWQTNRTCWSTYDMACYDHQHIVLDKNLIKNIG